MDTTARTPSPAAALFPLPASDTEASLLSSRTIERWTLAFLVLGILARCVRYFLRFPLWEDECFLCANLADRDYRGLLDPLSYHQVSPILFLWVQLTLVKLFGFSEMILRLFPFLAGIGSLVLFYRLAGICLTGLARLFAVALFSVTYAMIRYSAEAKPYGIDLFVSLVLVSLFVNWLTRPDEKRWLWLLTAAIPLALGLSYGAVMLGGGLSVTMAWVIWRQRRWDCLKPCLAFSLVLVGSFLIVYFACIRVQSATELEAMRDFWDEHFPPLTSFSEFAFWFAHVHCGDLLAYPGGGSPFQSTFSTICWVAGLLALARRRVGTMLVFCLAPQAVTFVAAALKRYPYGGHIRLNLYLAPFMCMVIGYGLTELLAWVKRHVRYSGLVLQRCLAALALVGAVCIARDLSGPYKNISDQRARGFAQWFWYNVSQNGEVACLTSDLGVIQTAGKDTKLNFSAQYLCNQRIYSPRHHAHKPVDWGKVSADHPLTCVLFRCNSLPDAETREQEAKFQAWQREMREKYDLVNRDSFPIIRQDKMGRNCDLDSIEILRFVPRSGPSPAATAHTRQEPRAIQVSQHGENR